MSYAVSIPIDTGTAGQLIKAALVYQGTIHATKRDLLLTEYGQGSYEFFYQEIPDGYQGLIMFYVGTLGADANFNAVAILGAISLNPQEFEAQNLFEAMLGELQFAGASPPCSPITLWKHAARC